MPDPGAWIATLKRFAAHMRDAVAEQVNTGLVDRDEVADYETVLHVAPPATPREFDEIAGSLPYKLPQSLRSFFLHGSREITFRYSIQLGEDAPGKLRRKQVSGGELPDVPGPIVAVDKLALYLSDAHEYAETSGISDFEEVQEVWKRAIPFHCFNNADYLAFDPIDDPEDPNVILLDHEGDPRLVARNFAAFLIEWPRVCYIGPGDIYEVEKFLDPNSGVLSGDVALAAALREVLKWRP